MAGNGSLYDVMFVKCGYLIMKKTLHEYLYNENKEWQLNDDVNFNRPF